MASYDTRFSYRIDRHAGEQGLRPSMGNQAQVETCATGTRSSHLATPEDEHAEEVPQNGLLETNTNIQQETQDSNRQHRTREEYREVMGT